MTLAISDTQGNDITGAAIDNAQGRITGIPVGTDLRITASSASCGEGTVLDVASCGDCQGTPLPLSVGPATCEGSGNTYSIAYDTAPGAAVTARDAAGDPVGDGSVPGIITGIPHGTDVTVSANNAQGCSSTVFTVDGPTAAQCADPACITPDLALGQPLCGTTGFSVAVSETTGADITAPAGTAYEDGVWTIPATAGFPLELVASNGNGCTSAIGFLSAPDCSNGGCDNALVSVGNAECTENDTYAVQYLLPEVPTDVTLIISDTDGNPIEGASIDNTTGRITNVPRGTALRVTATSASCSASTTVNVGPCTGECHNGAPPALTIGEPRCDMDGRTYSIGYNTAPGNTVLARDSSGDLVGDNSIPGTIRGIPLGTDVIVTSFGSAQCTTSLAVAGISARQCGDTSCSTPNLSIGQPVCGDGIYIVRVGETTGAQIIAPPGTSYADGVWIIPDVAIFPLELVASNGSGCLAAVGMNSAPECAGNGCGNPLVSLTAGECTDSDTYSVGFSLAQIPEDVELAISDTDGNPIEGANIDMASERINNIPRDTGLRVTATSESCSISTVVDVGPCASLCPTNAPDLSAVQMPTCEDPTGGIIEVTSPVGPNFEYSINGSDFRADVLFADLPTGTYTITARSMADPECTSPEATISFGQPVFSDGTPCNTIPSGFSPNNDGNNDTFSIALLETGQYPDFSIEIYDRWGNQVYQYQNNGQTGNAIPWWDGYSQGRRTLAKNEKVPVGTYYYIINFNSSNVEPRTGWLYVSY